MAQQHQRSHGDGQRGENEIGGADQHKAEQGRYDGDHGGEAVFCIAELIHQYNGEERRHGKIHARHIKGDQTADPCAQHTQYQPVGHYQYGGENIGALFVNTLLRFACTAEGEGFIRQIVGQEETTWAEAAEFFNERKKEII